MNRFFKNPIVLSLIIGALLGVLLIVFVLAPRIKSQQPTIRYTTPGVYQPTVVSWPTSTLTPTKKP